MKAYGGMEVHYPNCDGESSVNQIAENISIKYCNWFRKQFINDNNPSRIGEIVASLDNRQSRHSTMNSCNALAGLVIFQYSNR